MFLLFFCQKNKYLCSWIMEENVITSVQNARIKHVVALQQKSSLRREEGLFVVEGQREIEHCIACGYEIVEMFLRSKECGMRSENTPAADISPSSLHTPPSSENDNVIFLKTDYRIVKVSISDIRYVEAMSEYLKVWIEGESKPIITLLSMKKMEERLPDNFMRIHRSYIINLTKIQEVNKNRVIMDAETYLPIGDNYKEAFQAYLDTKFLGK